jgi:hypothetical protein
MGIYRCVLLIVATAFASLSIPVAALSNNRIIALGNEIIPRAYIVKLVNISERLGKREMHS